MSEQALPRILIQNGRVIDPSQSLDEVTNVLIEDGHIAVPEGPGLGFADLNEDVMREFADPDGAEIFASTEDWDDERAHDRLWS